MQTLKMIESIIILKVFYTRNNYVDHIIFIHCIRQKVIKTLIRDIVYIFEIIYVKTIYHYKAANKVLLTSTLMLILNHSEH